MGESLKNQSGTRILRVGHGRDARATLSNQVTTKFPEDELYLILPIASIANGCQFFSCSRLRIPELHRWSAMSNSHLSVRSTRQHRAWGGAKRNPRSPIN